MNTQPKYDSISEILQKLRHDNEDESGFDMTQGEVEVELTHRVADNAKVYTTISRCVAERLDNGSWVIRSTRTSTETYDNDIPF